MRRRNPECSRVLEKVQERPLRKGSKAQGKVASVRDEESPKTA